MLMVIFGAGASYDSCPTYPLGAQAIPSDLLNKHNRPPLANELFENRPLFAEAIDRFRECRPIVSRLRNLGERSIEAVLEDIQVEAETFPPAKQELAAVRCYLHHVITRTENEWRGVTRQVTNYLTLLREVERTYPKEPVCLVTFNYDTLLEDALLHFGLHIDSMSAYTLKHPFYRLFKLHGSVNWARQVEPEIVSKSTDPDTVLHHLIQRVAEIRATDAYIFSADRSIGVVQGVLAFPAIAIPVEKKRSFECPQGQLEDLVDLLPKVSKVLVIGWRASEAHFLAMLANKLTGLRPRVELYIVAGPDQQQGEEISVRICRALLNNPPQSPTVDTGGFTGFMLSGRAAKFLGN